MKMQGSLFWSLGIEPKAKVTEAIITSKRISVDWEEDGLEWHLEGNSRDGEYYSGNYGHPQKNPDYVFDLTLFRSKSEVALVGAWCQHDTGDEGTWFFRLTSESKPVAAQRTKGVKS